MRIFGELASAEQVSEINNLILKKFLAAPGDRVGDDPRSTDQSGRAVFYLRYEHLAGCDVPNDRKVALYVHISCLIERLISNASPSHYSGKQCPESELVILREAFSVIENGYGVKIPAVELYYIHDILTRNGIYSGRSRVLRLFIGLSPLTGTPLFLARRLQLKAVECAFEVG